MSTIEIVAIAAVFAVGALARLALPFLQSFTFRDLFRNSPEARAAFIGTGWWIKLSRRFGMPYVLALLGAALAWIVVGPSFIPDTTVGAWILFGPAIICGLLAVILGVLRQSRWEVDE